VTNCTFHHKLKLLIGELISNKVLRGIGHVLVVVCGDHFFPDVGYDLGFLVRHARTLAVNVRKFPGIC